MREAGAQLVPLGDAALSRTAARASTIRRRSSSPAAASTCSPPSASASSAPAIPRPTESPPPNASRAISPAPASPSPPAWRAASTPPPTKPASPLAAHHRRPRLRRRHCLPLRKPQARRRDRGEGPDHFRIPHGRDRLSAELPHPQPHHQRPELRPPGRRRRAVQRLGHHRPPRHGPGPRSLRRARQHHVQDELGAEPAHQARRETGAGLERCGRRSSPTRPATPHRRRPPTHFESGTWREL